MNYQPPDDNTKADYVRNNFNVIAKKYDIFNDLNSFGLHRLWKKNISRLVKKKAHNDTTKLICMDLCCGTGDISLCLLNLSETEKVYSIDFSENMLTIAKSKLVNFQERSEIFPGDATNLHQFKDNSLDVVTIGFGLRNVNHIQKALNEIRRVLKPGGIFINLDIGKVKIPVIKELANFYFFKIVPLMGYFLWGGKNEMFDYLPASSIKYPDQENLQLLLEKTGFIQVFFKNYVFGNVVMHYAVKAN